MLKYLWKVNSDYIIIKLLFNSKHILLLPLLLNVCRENGGWGVGAAWEPALRGLDPHQCGQESNERAVFICTISIKN